MLTIKKILQNNHLPLIIFHLVFALVIITNFPPQGRWFLGWDSLNPELNYSLNIKRSLFAGWEENYGLGTLGGHGFAAILPHSLITSLFSLVFPAIAIRPVFTFLCYYLGGLGLYFLTRQILFSFSKAKTLTINYVSLISVFFYLFNLATVQIFSVQLEAFIAHFASLPWLFWIIIRLLSRFSTKNLFLFFLINFFASIQGFIPALFVAYIVFLTIFLFTYLLKQHFSAISLRHSFLILIFTFFINAYWLLPFTYFSLTRSVTMSSAYNNLISTPNFVDQSQRYGTLQNATLFKGPYWDSYELGTYITAVWREHHQNLLVPIIGYLFFFLVIGGSVINFLKYKNYLLFAFSLGFLYFFGGIAITTPPFSFFNQLIKVISPTYYQAFRIAFTKLGLGSVFTASILISVSLLFLSQAKNHLFGKITLALLTLSLFFYALPIFQNNFIFRKMYIRLPSAYLQIIDFFKNQPDGRIADLPQDCPEGWYGYQWGYFGSGFYWYGIKQPFLSRTFDVWSPNNENYYWELSQALRQQNYDTVDQIFQKYNTNWILYDPNFIHCRTPKAFINKTDLLNLFDKNPQYKLVKTFTSDNLLPIRLYQRSTNSNSFVSLGSNLPNIGPVYNYNDLDPAISQAYFSDSRLPYQQYFPFRDLFTKRNSQKTPAIATDDQSATFSTTLPTGLQNYSLSSNFLTDNYLPVSVNLQKTLKNSYQVYLTPVIPSITLDHKLLNQQPSAIKIGEFTAPANSSFQIFINDISASLESTVSGIFYNSIQNSINIFIRQSQPLFSWTETSPGSTLQFSSLSPIILPSYRQGLLAVQVPKIDDLKFSRSLTSPFDNNFPKLCDSTSSPDQNKFELRNTETEKYLRFITQNTKQCLGITINDLSTNFSYLLALNIRHQQGQSLFFHVTNKTRPVGLDLYLQPTSDFQPQYLILPPTIPNETQYEFSFESESLTQTPTINDLGDIRLTAIPYLYLKNLSLSSPSGQNIAVTISQLSVTHPNETFYKIEISSVTPNSHLILYQSYAPEWLAFYFTNLRPVLLSKHTLINNWANGWELPQDLTRQRANAPTIYIFFWPQILEFIGLGLLLLLPLVFLCKSLIVHLRSGQ